MVRFLLQLFLVITISFSCNSKENEKNISDIRLEKIVGSMEEELLKYNVKIDLLKTQYEHFISNKEEYLQKADRKKYKFNEGISTNLPEMDSSLSTLFISTLNPNFEKALEETYFTQGLDSLFFALFNKDKLITQIYANSTQHVSRLYPSYDAASFLEKDVDVTTFNFYYLGDLEHNPSKGPVWISEAYIDPVGRGWVVSLIQPVYDKEKLFAVLGIDFSINGIIQRYLDDETGKLMIVNSKGDIVAGKSLAIEALSMPPLKNHIYEETIQMDNFRISDFNLFNSKSEEVRLMAQSIFLKKEKSFSFQNENGLKTASVVPFTILDWYLIELK